MKILHLEDNPRDVALVRDMLSAEWPNCFISVVATRDDFVSLLKLGGYDLVLSDFQLPGFNGLEALEIVREMAPDIPFVFFSGTLGEESAIDAVRAGAADYVIKDRMQRLPVSIQRVIREAAEQRGRREVEAALAQEQYLLRLLMENLPDHVYFKDTHSSFITVSRSLAATFGLQPEQLRGKSDFDFFSEEHARKAFDDEQRIIRTGEPMLNVEEREVWPDGRVTWVSSTKLPLRDATGRIIGTFGISHDVTSRKQAEESIRQQAEIIDHSPIAIVVTDLTNRISYLNIGACQLYGVTREEAIGRDADDFITAETIARIEPGRVATIGGGEWSGTVPVVTRSGRQFEGEFHMSIIRDTAGRPRARLCIAIDVTEKKKLEEQFLRAQRLESLGMLAAGIAHDLNNVLAPILMGAPLLHTRAMHPSDLRVLEAIEASASRGAGLVRQILSFAHGAGGDKVLIQPRHLLADIVTLIQQTFPKNIVLDAQVAPDLWPVSGNPTQLHQVVLNLCVNARDAMPLGGRLTLQAVNRRIGSGDVGVSQSSRPGPYVEIVVTDTGTGIPPEVLERMWEPFFTTKGEGKGTGLGLATVRGIATNHNGFVNVDSTVGKGTTFRVFLPATEATTPAGVGAKTENPNVTRGRGELVLIVDDEESIRDLVVAVLSRFGYRVLAAANGTEAMALYAPRAEEIGLVITDLGMPEMGGAKLAAALQRLTPSVRLLFISGGDMMSTEPAPPGAQMLQKPFTGHDLLTSVQAAMGARI